MTPEGRVMQWCRPILALGCCVGAVLDEEAGRIYMILDGRPMQRSRPFLALGCHVGAVLDEEADRYIWPTREVRSKGVSSPGKL